MPNHEAQYVHSMPSFQAVSGADPAHACPSRKLAQPQGLELHPNFDRADDD